MSSSSTKIETLRFSRHLVRLRFTSPARFSHFLHGGVVHGLLGHALAERQLPAGLVPAAPESGRMSYEVKDAYHLGITLVGEARGELKRIERGLHRIGHDSAPARTALGGNFEVEAVERLPAVDVDAEVAALGGGVRDLRFVSPLRQERPTDLADRNRSYLDRECFPLCHFFDRMWRRLFFLHAGRWPTNEEREAAMPSLPLKAEVDPSELFWIDLPHPERRRTLGGVLGRVAVHGLDERSLNGDWLPLLVLGRHLQAGASTNFAFGRFVMADEFGPLETPARRLLDELGNQERLDRALDHVSEQSVAAGVDGITPAGFRGERAVRVPALARAVCEGSVETSPLLGVPARRNRHRKARPLAVPTVGDRVLQRATSEFFGATIDQLFEDCSFAYQKGLSRAGAARALERAYADGFRIVLDADLSAFFEEVRWDRLFAKLEAFFPGEPLLDLIRAWVTAPIHFGDMQLLRERGLAEGAPVSRLLARLYLSELSSEILGNEFRLLRYGNDFVVVCRDVESAERARDRVRAGVPDLRSRSWLTQVPLGHVRGVLAMSSSGRRRRVRIVSAGEASSAHPSEVVTMLQRQHQLL